MTLAYPYLLLLTLAALAAGWWALSRLEGRRSALAFPRVQGVKPSWRTTAARLLPPALRTAALVLLALGLARPQKVSSRTQGIGEGIDIMLLIDTSTSMNALDFQPENRLFAAKDTAVRFIRGRAQDRVGLVIFGGAAILSCPLTLDYEALAGRVAELEAGMTHADGTSIGDGIVTGVNHIRNSDGKSKVLILLTDGRHNTGIIDPLTAAKVAKTFGVKIYTIGCAKRGEALMPVDDPKFGRVMVRVRDDLDEDGLNEIARVTDGRYWRATSLAELREVYASIDALEKTKVKLPEIVSRADRYALPVTLAILLLLAELALSNIFFLRWP
ncbi:MAG: VWA domain-containing protein [Elusimicrobia bacterium]|nr:VWA domain-containing protein [Elusimicrobiota bacterium]